MDGKFEAFLPATGLQKGALPEVELPRQALAPPKGPSSRAEEALALMCRHLDEPLTIAGIAARLGVGMRLLQMAFARRYGLSPREMLVRLRLERARAELLVAGPQTRVTTIALDAGFTHLSRFASAYQQSFGERPVDTLRRMREG